MRPGRFKSAEVDQNAAPKGTRVAGRSSGSQGRTEATRLSFRRIITATEGHLKCVFRFKIPFVYKKKSKGANAAMGERERPVGCVSVVAPFKYFPR